MSTYTDVNADGSSRQHNGNNYNYHYYGTGPQDAGASRQPRQADLSGNSSSDNGLKLWRAVKAGQLPRVKHLLKTGADVNYRCEENGTTPLHQAALAGDADILEALLQADANFDDEDKEGATALHYAVKSSVAVALIRAGADVDHEDRAGRTPGVVKVLLDNHDDPGKIHLMIGDGDEAGLEQDSELGQASFRTTADLITVPKNDGLSEPNLSNTEPGKTLVIGISLESSLDVVAYASADRQISFGWDIREPHRMNSPTKRPNKAYYGIDSDFNYFGFVLDPDMAGRAGPKADLMRQQLEATNRTAEGAVSLFIRALYNYVLEVFAFEDPGHSLENLRSEVIVTVPPNWPVKSRIDIMEAAKNNGLRNVTLIRAADAAVLHTLHCASNKHTAVCKILLICVLQGASLTCTTERVISLKPLQLRQLGPVAILQKDPWEDKPHRKFNIPFYHTKTPAEEHQQAFLNHNALWREDIRHFIAAQVKQLGENSIETIHLVGSVGSINPRDFMSLLAKITEDNPGVKVLHRRHQMAREPSVLGTEAVMYGLLKNIGED